MTVSLKDPIMTKWNTHCTLIRSQPSTQSTAVQARPQPDVHTPQPAAIVVWSGGQMRWLAAVIDVAVKAAAAVLALLLPHPSGAEQNIGRSRPWGEEARLQHTEKHPAKCQRATVIYLPVMFPDCYYAHSFAATYTAESSAVSDGCNIVKRWAFDANCPTFDPVPPQAGNELEDVWKSCEKRVLEMSVRSLHAARHHILSCPTVHSQGWILIICLQLPSSELELKKPLGWEVKRPLKIWHTSGCLRYSTQNYHDLDDWEPSSPRY